MRSFWKPAPVDISRREKKSSEEKEYRENSATVRRLDGYRCRLCGTLTHLTTHHLIARSLLGRALRHAITNLMTLCADCHEDVQRHRVKLYPLDAAQGTRGLLRAERWNKDEGGYVTYLEAA